MQSYEITLSVGKTTIAAGTSDEAVRMALTNAGLPFADFVSVYAKTPTPRLDCRYGAPMGRGSDKLDPDGIFRARRVPVDGGGYDAGGAYWGLRLNGQSIYAVEDGMGNLAFVDAANRAEAIRRATEEPQDA